MNLEDFFSRDAYGLADGQRRPLLLGRLRCLTAAHYANCPAYRAILDGLGLDPAAARSVEEIPFIPVRLFKYYELMSVPRERVLRVLTSSGTTSQQKARIFLDKENLVNQSRVLSRLVQSFIGPRRLPMLIFDTAAVNRDAAAFSARGGGVNGFSLFGRRPRFAFRDDMSLDLELLRGFHAAHRHEPVLFFGYTYMIWRYLVRALEQAGESFEFEDAVLFHTGGWKKLLGERVSADEFNARLTGLLGRVRIYNQYGMAEQLGSVFFECGHGHMHVSLFSDVIVRRARDFAPAAPGERGLLQLLSVLPTSYPGHSLLTEDEGVILGADDCPCGRRGKYFKILGRVTNAELRGCSDTYEGH